MELQRSSLENIRNLRRQKLSELLFPSFGTRHERMLYGGAVNSFVENAEEIGYYINRGSEILDFYVKKEFDYLADDCFSSVLQQIEKPVISIRSDDSLLINLVFNYLIDLEKGGYLFVRDKRHYLPELKDSSLHFSPLSDDNFDGTGKILSEEETFFYNGCNSGEREMLKNYIGKDMFFCLLLDAAVIGVGYNQPVRNRCSEVGVLIDKEFRRKGYATLLLSELAKLIENEGYQCFAELPSLDMIGRKLMEKLGFYVIAKYFIATIKGKIEDNNVKKRHRRYSLTGLFRVL